MCCLFTTYTFINTVIKGQPVVEILSTKGTQVFTSRLCFGFLCSYVTVTRYSYCYRRRLSCQRRCCSGFQFKRGRCERKSLLYTDALHFLLYNACSYSILYTTTMSVFVLKSQVHCFVTVQLSHSITSLQLVSS